MTELCSGTQIDVATQDEIFDWYQYRHVCDNDKFPVFFNRQLKLVEWQYLQQLRLQLTDIDPMVSDYLERQILRDDKTTEQRSDSKTQTSTGTSEQSVVNGGQDKVTGSNDKTVDSTDTAETEVNTNDTGTQDTTGKTNGDRKHMESTMPDMSAYGAEDGGPQTGMPDDLNWSYLSAQAEDKSGDTSEEHVNSTDVGTSKTTGTNTGKTTEAGTNEQTTIHGLTVDTTGSDDRTVTDEGTGETTGVTNSDTRERQTGRHEAPQDMLDRARSYIVKTNAFRWLIDQLDVCFFGIYGEEWE